MNVEIMNKMAIGFGLVAALTCILAFVVLYVRNGESNFILLALGAVIFSLVMVVRSLYMSKTEKK